MMYSLDLIECTWVYTTSIKCGSLERLDNLQKKLQQKSTSLKFVSLEQIKGNYHKSCKIKKKTSIIWVP